MKLGQIIDSSGKIEDIKQNILVYKYMDSYTTETYMLHDESIQPKHFSRLIFSCEAFIHYYWLESFPVMKLSIRRLVSIY